MSFAGSWAINDPPVKVLWVHVDINTLGTLSRDQQASCPLSQTPVSRGGAETATSFGDGGQPGPRRWRAAQKYRESGVSGGFRTAAMLGHNFCCLALCPQLATAGSDFPRKPCIFLLPSLPSCLQPSLWDPCSCSHNCKLPGGCGQRPPHRQASTAPRGVGRLPTNTVQLSNRMSGNDHLRAFPPLSIWSLAT